MLVDCRLRGTDVGDLLLGEPLGDVRAFLEVHRGAVYVVRDVLQQPAGEVEDRLARGPRRFVVHRGNGPVRGLAIDVEQDQRLAGVVVIHRGLVEAHHVGDVVDPGAVVAAGREQFGRDGQQLLATRWLGTVTAVRVATWPHGPPLYFPLSRPPKP